MYNANGPVLHRATFAYAPHYSALHKTPEACFLSARERMLAGGLTGRWSQVWAEEVGSIVCRISGEEREGFFVTCYLLLKSLTEFAGVSNRLEDLVIATLVVR